MSSMASDSIIGPETGERERGLKHIEGWLKKNLKDYLKICDPFLGPEEVILILKMVYRG